MFVNEPLVFRIRAPVCVPDKMWNTPPLNREYLPLIFFMNCIRMRTRWLFVNLHVATLWTLVPIQVRNWHTLLRQLIIRFVMSDLRYSFSHKPLVLYQRELVTRCFSQPMELTLIILHHLEAFINVLVVIRSYLLFLLLPHRFEKAVTRTLRELPKSIPIQKESRLNHPIRV